MTTHKLNTDSQGFWVGANPKSLEVIVYLRSKIFRQLRWGEDFYIDLLEALAKMATSRMASWPRAPAVQW